MQCGTARTLPSHNLPSQIAWPCFSRAVFCARCRHHTVPHLVLWLPCSCRDSLRHIPPQPVYWPRQWRPEVCPGGMSPQTANCVVTHQLICCRATPRCGKPTSGYPPSCMQCPSAPPRCSWRRHPWSLGRLSASRISRTGWQPGAMLTAARMAKPLGFAHWVCKQVPEVLPGATAGQLIFRICTIGRCTGLHLVH